MLKLTSLSGLAPCRRRWDVSSAAYSLLSFSVSSQTTAPHDLTFGKRGLKMYVLADGAIYEYDLASPYSLAAGNVSYSGNALDISNEETQARGLSVSQDGSKLFAVGFGGRSVYEYTLSTPWSLSGASYSSNSFSVAGQDTQPVSMFFRSNGAAFYISGQSSDTIYQYNLSTAWTLSSAAYASKSFAVSSQDTSPTGLGFRDNGKAFYIIGAVNDSVFQYYLSTPWDISTAVYASKSLAVSSQEDTPTGVYFRPGGWLLFSIGLTQDAVHQFHMSH